MAIGLVLLLGAMVAAGWLSRPRDVTPPDLRVALVGNITVRGRNFAGFVVTNREADQVRVDEVRLQVRQDGTWVPVPPGRPLTVDVESGKGMIFGAGPEFHLRPGQVQTFLVEWRDLKPVMESLTREDCRLVLRCNRSLSRRDNWWRQVQFAWRDRNLAWLRDRWVFWGPTTEVSSGSIPEASLVTAAVSIARPGSRDSAKLDGSLWDLVRPVPNPDSP